MAAMAAGVGFQKGDIIVSVNNQKIGKTADLQRATKDVSRFCASRCCAAAKQITSRSADEPEATTRNDQPVRGRRNGARCAASLPDRLRPRSLSDVVGQDHILGPDGALTRMLETRTLGSLIFWGPPGTAGPR